MTILNKATSFTAHHSRSVGEAQRNPRLLPVHRKRLLEHDGFRLTRRKGQGLCPWTPLGPKAPNPNFICSETGIDAERVDLIHGSARSTGRLPPRSASDSGGTPSGSRGRAPGLGLFHCPSGTTAPGGIPCSISFGKSPLCQPPPRALTSRILASTRRRRMSTSLR